MRNSTDLRDNHRLIFAWKLLISAKILDKLWTNFTVSFCTKKWRFYGWNNLGILSEILPEIFENINSHRSFRFCCVKKKTGKIFFYEQKERDLASRVAYSRDEGSSFSVYSFAIDSRYRRANEIWRRNIAKTMEISCFRENHLSVKYEASHRFAMFCFSSMFGPNDNVSPLKWPLTQKKIHRFQANQSLDDRNEFVFYKRHCQISNTRRVSRSYKRYKCEQSF